MNKDLHASLPTRAVDQLRLLPLMLRRTRRARSRLRSLECRITDRLARTHLRIPHRPISPSRSGSHLATKGRAFLERVEATTGKHTKTTREEDGLPRRFTEAISHRTGSHLQDSQGRLNSLPVRQAFPVLQDTASTGSGNCVTIELERRIEVRTCF